MMSNKSKTTLWLIWTFLMSAGRQIDRQGPMRKKR